MPAKADILLRHPFEILFYVNLQQFVAHARHRTAVDLTLVTIVTVMTIEVARRAYGLDHSPEGRCPSHLSDIRQMQIILPVTLHNSLLCYKLLLVILFLQLLKLLLQHRGNLLGSRLTVDIVQFMLVGIEII